MSPGFIEDTSFLPLIVHYVCFFQNKTDLCHISVGLDISVMSGYTKHYYITYFTLNILLV